VKVKKDWIFSSVFADNAHMEDYQDDPILYFSSPASMSMLLTRVRHMLKRFNADYDFGADRFDYLDKLAEIENFFIPIMGQALSDDFSDLEKSYAELVQKHGKARDLSQWIELDFLRENGFVDFAKTSHHLRRMSAFLEDLAFAISPTIVPENSPNELSFFGEAFSELSSQSLALAWAQAVYVPLNVVLNNLDRMVSVEKTARISPRKIATTILEMKRATIDQIEVVRDIINEIYDVETGTGYLTGTMLPDPCMREVATAARDVFESYDALAWVHYHAQFRGTPENRRLAENMRTSLAAVALKWYKPHDKLLDPFLSLDIHPLFMPKPRLRGHEPS
jgi:hypothetical protein